MLTGRNTFCSQFCVFIPKSWYCFSMPKYLKNWLVWCCIAYMTSFRKFNTRLRIILFTAIGWSDVLFKYCLFIFIWAVILLLMVMIFDNTVFFDIVCFFMLFDGAMLLLVCCCPLPPVYRAICCSRFDISCCRASLVLSRSLSHSPNQYMRINGGEHRQRVWHFVFQKMKKKIITIAGSIIAESNFPHAININSALRIH